MGPDQIQLATTGSQYLHVRVLLGMVIGLGLTHLLRQFARMIDASSRKDMSWIHMMWVGFVFVYLLHFWWWEFRLGAVQWTFILYLFVTLYALLLYLLSAVVFPESMEGHANYDRYFMARRPWFFGLLAAVFLIDLCDTWIKGRAYFESLGPEYVARNVVHIVLCIVAMSTRNRWFQGAFVIAASIYQISWIVRQFETL